MKKNSQLYKFLTALLERNLSTLEAEKIVDTTRIANVATIARHKYGLLLPCILQPNTKPDGTQGTYGIYTPTECDRKKIAKALVSVA